MWSTEASTMSEASPEAPIRPLIDRLSFIRNKGRWGQTFRSGHFEIHREDFELIASAMGLNLGTEPEDRSEGRRGG
jgi:hypothetical protein